jgi:hypothetical protein
MRILVAIPHYYGRSSALSPDGAWHGSVSQEPRVRIAALSACISALHQLYGPAQYLIDHVTRRAMPANERTSGRVEVIVCTTGEDHLLDRLSLPTGSFIHRPTDCRPALLGFECHAALRERLGDHDYYAYLEDDLIAHDPWLFVKLGWFTASLGDGVLLQPNRYEVGPLGPVHRAYIDGDLPVEVTAPFQNLEVAPVATGQLLGRTVTFQRPKNPHAGCFFLNARQMETWAGRADFLDRDTGFVGPLESAASLGVMRTFRVYKAAAADAGFLEIQHFGTSYLEQLCVLGNASRPVD